MISRIFQTLLALALLFSLSGRAIGAEEAGSGDSGLQKKVSVNLKGVDVRKAFSLIGEQAGLQIAVGAEVTGVVNYAASDRTVQQALDELTRQLGLSYSLHDGVVVVTQDGVAEGEAARADAASGSGSPDVHEISLKYAAANDLMPKLSSVLTKSERMMVDDANNAIVFIGSSMTFERVRGMVEIFDRPPQQILIQGMIVETNDSFLRAVGMAFGNPGGKSVGAGAPAQGYTDTNGPVPANFGFTAGSIAGKILDMKLTAAESNGDAKIISRPKVVTLNNRQATISSGLTINVKTLSSTQSAASGQTPVAVTGGLSSLNAGLSVAILPTIVGDKEVRLVLNVISSSPDESNEVDGIPGVQSNTASTAVIVKDGHTAIIAGLIKQIKNDSHDGVPILKDIPILGFFFQSHSRSDQNSELAIFITPTILSAGSDVFNPLVPSPSQMLRTVGDVSQKPHGDSDYLGNPNSPKK